MTAPSNYSSYDARLPTDNNGNGDGAGANGHSDAAAEQKKVPGVNDAVATEDDDVAGEHAEPLPRPIVLRKDDPPPPKIETQLFRMKGLITRFTENSLEGRHIPLEDWFALLESTGEMHCQLDRLEFSWTEEEEEERIGSQDAL